MAKRSGKSKAPKAKHLREVGEKAKGSTVVKTGDGRVVVPGDWVEMEAGTAGRLVPAWVSEVEGQHTPPRVVAAWPNPWAGDAEDERGRWNPGSYVSAVKIADVGLQRMSERTLMRLAEVLQLRGLPDGADPGLHGAAVWREMAIRGLKTAYDQKHERGESDAGEDEPADAADGVHAGDVDGVADDVDSVTFTGAGQSVTLKGDSLKRFVDGEAGPAGVAAATEGVEPGTKPSETVMVTFDRPVGKLVGEGEMAEVRVLHDRRGDEAWAVATDGRVMAAVPVMLALPDTLPPAWEADLVPGPAAVGTASKPRTVELRKGRKEGLFDSGWAWVSSMENRWWQTWAPTRPCVWADALPEVNAAGVGVVAVRVNAEQLAAMAKVIGDENGAVVLLLDTGRLAATAAEKVTVGVVGEDDSGVGAPVGVLMMERADRGACAEYAATRERLLRLTVQPRNTMVGKV